MSYEDFMAYTNSPEYREIKRREYNHKVTCYGSNCISCGCYRPEKRCCVHHQGSDAYKNELLERIANAQERIADGK